ncbi:hypothetical protein CEUSTIGMA_g4754.t1 [Chlamydomonas eustigma]|uniref:Protease Do-like PDZ domain-containing protein n=1 Tax=Chlamydomonas eustigma TaxID=1157962 RepID=A0A250X2L4_9CHLO|nr:hypothetical protein CEUSTIGMA_g4754.t1 [Chlamydomonas eustigma]|eukprot:GAX77308.1 hypothetical protein CEUSTIGMA_g4754.t1 [Chlamydomonas eustigma]
MIKLPPSVLCSSRHGLHSIPKLRLVSKSCRVRGTHSFWKCKLSSQSNWANIQKSAQEEVTQEESLRSRACSNEAWNENEGLIYDDDEEAEEEEEAGESEFGASVVQVRTVHRVPNFQRPWETGQDVESSSSAFVVDTEHQILMTTAGAVEYAKKVTVSKDDEEFEASIMYVSTDYDTALIKVKEASFWRGMMALEFGALPLLQHPIKVLGFPIGGDMLAITSGVVSRIEVIEYTHSGRGLLAIQVDAAVNSGSWGGPVIDAAGRCVGMAFQKGTGQTWMERYDASLGSEVSSNNEDEEDDVEAGGHQGDNDDYQGEGYDDDYDEEGGGLENIAYAVPSLILWRCLEGHIEAMSQNLTAQKKSRTLDFGGMAEAKGRLKKRSHDSAIRLELTANSGSDVCDLRELPTLGLRWQRGESQFMREALGLIGPAYQGVLITGVDPQGSCGGVLQPGDLLLSLGGMKVSAEGTIELYVEDSMHNEKHLLMPEQKTVRSGGDAGDQDEETVQTSSLAAMSSPLSSNCNVITSSSPVKKCKERHRVMFGHAANFGKLGERMEVEVVRGQQRKKLEISLRQCLSVVPSSLGLSRPQYMMVAGLVFAPFVEPFLYDYEPPRVGRRRRLVPTVWNASYLHLGMALEWSLAERPNEQVVTLISILPGSNASTDYSELSRSPRRLKSLNNVEILNMEHLAQEVVLLTSALEITPPVRPGIWGPRMQEHPSSQNESTQSLPTSTFLSASLTPVDSPSSHSNAVNFLRLEFSDGSVIVLDAESARSQTLQLLKEQSISFAMSSDLRACLPLHMGHWPEDAGMGSEVGGEVTTRQSRQQRRRLAMRR